MTRTRQHSKFVEEKLEESTKLHNKETLIMPASHENQKGINFLNLLVGYQMTIVSFGNPCFRKKRS